VSITNYAELKSAIGDFLNRDDLTAVIPTFISLGEARIARDLNHWKQEKRVTTDIDERYEDLPNDWISIIQVQHTDGGVISSASSSEMADYRAQSNTPAKPRYWRLTANEMEFYPIPDATYNITMLYRARIPALTDADPSNWLLTYSPDVVLYAALMQSAPYLADDARVAVWGSMYQSGVEALNNESAQAQVSGPLSMRIPR
jgi:hypothetical protein